MTDQNSTHSPRIIKIGTTRIVADEGLAALDAEAIRTLLKSSYPEITHATVRETTLDDGSRLLEYIAVAGRKG